ncbi:MAG: hypothetical protein COB30_013940 [Ectothiorhodospiraceae bacterium]|nr:hypothetical protein [Ectothiorhodospiraceae bacterium]
MAEIKQTPVTLKDNDDKTTPGQLQTTWFNHNDCVKRGLTKLGLFWLLALGSVPIVFAHWVLVPGLLIAGPWMGYTTYKMKRRHDHISGNCPSCQAEIKIKTEAKQSLTMWTYCPTCNTPLQIAENN